MWNRVRTRSRTAPCRGDRRPSRSVNEVAPNRFGRKVRFRIRRLHREQRPPFGGVPLLVQGSARVPDPQVLAIRLDGRVLPPLAWEALTLDERTWLLDIAAEAFPWVADHETLVRLEVFHGEDRLYVEDIAVAGYQA